VLCVTNYGQVRATCEDAVTVITLMTFKTEVYLQTTNEEEDLSRSKYLPYLCVKNIK